MSTPTEPWYRQGWPWFLILLPGTVVVAAVITLFIALAHPQSLVRDDYYKDGLAVNRHLAQDELARSRGMFAELRYDAATRVVSLRLVQPGTEASQSLRLELIHPTDAALDEQLRLERGQDGLHSARLVSPLVSRRHLLLEDHAEPSPWRLRGTLDANQYGGSVTLAPAPG